ncbi:13348_t:CDS:2, partial [Funneliformis caledonium]
EESKGDETAPHLKNDMAPKESKTSKILWYYFHWQFWYVIVILAFSPLILAFGLATIACGTRSQEFLRKIHRPLTPPIEDKNLEPIIFPTLKELDVKISVTYSWQKITKANTTLFVYSNKVYDLGNYLDPSNEDKLLGDDSVTEWLRGLLGDVEGTTIGCFANKDDTTSHLLLLVTCYSEGEHSMHTTLDSLTSTDYSDKQKLLMVIAGGDITGSDNDKTTPEICEDLIEPFNLSSFESPTPQSYLAVGEDGTPEE